jgi:hypothetical protein
MAAGSNEVSVRQGGDAKVADHNKPVSASGAKAIQSQPECGSMDCFVASLLALTGGDSSITNQRGDDIAALFILILLNGFRLRSTRPAHRQ